jgi:hypothetical protein
MGVLGQTPEYEGFPGRASCRRRIEFTRGASDAQAVGIPEGGRTAAVLTSLLATCKALRIDPLAYLRDIFARISSRPQSRRGGPLPRQLKAEGFAAPTP